jgi:hydrogenase-4 component E
MNMSPTEFLSIGAAAFALLMLGSGRLKFNLLTYALQTLLIAAVTVIHSWQATEEIVFLVSLFIVVSKALFVPYFLSWVVTKIDVRSDPGVFLPIPLSMHASIVLLGMAHLLASSLPHSSIPGGTTGDATAAISLLFSGMLFMLTRRAAISQIIGFLTMENAIYLFAITQTRGMPMIVEMGVLLDLLVALMIAGLIAFRIKRSFEHIDVSQLTNLKD